MNYVSWGRKQCSICSINPQESEISGGARLCRTGVCIQCDAGLCKSFFHVSCAQAAGLLSEPAYVTSASISTSNLSFLKRKFHENSNLIFNGFFFSGCEGSIFGTL